jgi:outer membrane protein
MKKTRISLLIGLISFLPLATQADSLLEVYESALKNDAQLKADKAQYDANKEYQTLNRSGLLPQISASASVGKTDQETTNNLTNTTTKTDSDSQGWDISLDQKLFDMSAWYIYKQGKKLSEQAEAQFGADQQSLIVRVASAYFDVLRNVDILEASLAEEKALAKQLEQTKQRFDVGLTAITEVHEAQAAYDSAVAAKLEAQGNLSISYEALEVLTGQPEDQVAPLMSSFPVIEPSPSNRADWVEFALKNNYSLKASRLNADAQLDRAKSAKSRHLPTLGASVTYGDSSRDGVGDMGNFDNETDGTTVGIRLDVPIFAGGATSAGSRQAYAQYTQAQEIYNKTQRDVIQGARASHLSVETGVARVQARKQAIVSSQSALEATQSGYEVGTRNLVEVLLAQRNLYQARRNYSDALYDYVIDTIKLREVAGMLTPADVQEIDKWLMKDRQVSRSQYE